MKQIVQACFPVDNDEAIRLWHDIKPIKFGDRLTWLASAPDRVLALYQVPENATSLLILKVECYTFTNDVVAPGFRNFEPAPNGTARWLINVGAGADPLTALVPIHLLTEASEFLIVKGGAIVSLEATLGAPPDANTRFIRTIVYGYHISAQIADRIGSGEVIVFGRDT